MMTRFSASNRIVGRAPWSRIGLAAGILLSRSYTADAVPAAEARGHETAVALRLEPIHLCLATGAQREPARTDAVGGKLNLEPKELQFQRSGRGRNAAGCASGRRRNFPRRKATQRA